MLDLAVVQVHADFVTRLLAEPAALTTILPIVDLSLTAPPCCFSSLGVGRRAFWFLSRAGEDELERLRRPNLVEDFET